MPFDIGPEAFVGPGGRLPIDDDDEVLRRLAMLIEGECGTVGRAEAARMFGFCRQRYFQLRAIFQRHGVEGLLPRPPGPKRNYRRTNEVVCQMIRHRFLDPEASPAVIAQKLRQVGFSIGARSVERTFAEFGLQKKTLSVPSRPDRDGAGHVSHPDKKTAGTGRSRQSGTWRKGAARG